MPRPRSLSRSDITRAALVVLDRDGPAGLSMRAVAAELGTSAMALYRYVDRREELERWVVERVLDVVDLALPETPSWTARVVLLMERVREAVAAHPAAVPLLLTHRHAAPASLRWIETMLGVLADAGLTDTERVVAQRSLVSYLVGALQTEHLGPLSGQGTATMAALPDDEFPHLTAVAGRARQVTADEQFRAGLTALLRGLDAGATRRDRPPDR